ncbi:pyruvate/2-oxoglutarate dehydrogenase complex dihydrolipoamide acyltransferase (E2) component [Bradyrhizobium sp. USDA 4461]
MRFDRTLALSCVLMLAPVVAAAQAPPTPATPPAQTAPPAPQRAAQNQNCAPQQPSRPGAAAPEGTTTGQASQPLGDKLAKSDGVLCPPAGVDPDMRAPTPEGGNTPVIPPPGSPGGDPTVRPK